MRLLDSIASQMGNVAGSQGDLLKEAPALLGQLKEHSDKGTDPQDPVVKNPAQQVRDLIQKATGKTLSSEQDLQDLVEKYRPLLKPYLGDKVPDQKVVSYISKALGLTAA